MTSSDPIERQTAAPRPDLADLRARVRAIEAGTREESPSLPFGLAPVDGCLPDGGLPLACLHEVSGGGGQAGDGAAMAFTAVLAARLSANRRRPVLWLAPRLTLYPPGLSAFGLTPDRLLVARAGRPADLLWALEEATRSPGLAAIVAQDVAVDLTASRRLQLAAEASGTTPLLLQSGASGRAKGASAATTRWSVTAAPGQDRAGEAGWPGFGDARWQVALTRCRAGRPGDWTLIWRDGVWHLDGKGANAWAVDRPGPAYDDAGSAARPAPANAA